MVKVMAICGKICSGKSYYSKQLKEKEKAVILSCDEVTSVLFDNNLGDKHDEITKRIREYLLCKSVEMVTAGTNVILDWGFWTKQDRDNIKEFFDNLKIKIEMHYIDIDFNSWQKNIQERNDRILSGKGGSDYFLDEGLLNKLNSFWQEPTKEEIDIWVKLKR